MINEILVQVYLTVEPGVVSAVMVFIIGIDKLRRWKPLTLDPSTFNLEPLW